MQNMGQQDLQQNDHSQISNMNSAVSSYIASNSNIPIIGQYLIPFSHLSFW